jgi:hypothetical protein
LEREIYNYEASFAAAMKANEYIQQGMLPMWTIYGHPLDFPAHFVVRLHLVDGSGEPKVYRFGVVCDSLEEARQQVPVYCAVLPREAADDPNIVETWI